MLTWFPNIMVFTITYDILFYVYFEKVNVTYNFSISYLEIFFHILLIIMLITNDSLFVARLCKLEKSKIIISLM